MNRQEEIYFEKKMVSLAKMFARFTKRFYQTPDAENDPAINLGAERYHATASKLFKAFEQAGGNAPGAPDWNGMMEKSGARRIIDDAMNRYGTEDSPPTP